MDKRKNLVHFFWCHKFQLVSGANHFWVLFFEFGLHPMLPGLPGHYNCAEF